MQRDVHFELDQLFSAPIQEARKPNASMRPVNGIEAANRAVAECAEDSSMIFLTKSEYEDLIFRAVVPELKTYKKKTIFVVSDEVMNVL